MERFRNQRVPHPRRGPRNVFLRVLGGITKEQSVALDKQIEDAGYVLAKIKVGFLTEPPQ